MAATPSTPAPIEFNLDCSLCLCVFKEPVIIGCGHTFCRDCITGWIMATPAYQPSFSCPMCREKNPRNAPLLPDNELAAKVRAASPFTPAPSVSIPPSVPAAPSVTAYDPKPIVRALLPPSVFVPLPNSRRVAEEFPASLELCAPCKKLMELTGRDVDSVLKNFACYCTNCLLTLQKHALTRLERNHPDKFQSGQLTTSTSRATPSPSDRCALDAFTERRNGWRPVVIFLDEVDGILSNAEEEDGMESTLKHLMEYTGYTQMAAVLSGPEERKELDAEFLNLIRPPRQQEAAEEGRESQNANRPEHGHKRKRHGTNKRSRKSGKKSEPRV